MLNRVSLPNANKVSGALLTSIMFAFGFVEIVSMFIDFSTEWPWLVGCLLYSATINDVFCHRICAHGNFTINEKSLTFKIFVLLNAIDNSLPSPRAFLLHHCLHHRHANSIYDPGSYHYWLTSAISLPLREFVITPQPPGATQQFIQTRNTTHKNIINDRWTIFCEKNQVVISVIVFAILALLAPVILFKIIFPGRVLLSVVLAYHVLCHYDKVPFNYRITKSNNSAFNNLFLHYSVLGLAGSYTLQSTHHSYPSSLNLGKKWYELDTAYPIASLLKYLIEKRS